MKHFHPLENKDAVNSILDQIAFLGGVSKTQREKVFQRLEVGTFKSGEYISECGEEPSHIYIVEKGKVALMICGDGTEVCKRHFEVGDCFGEAALLSMRNNTASFLATEDSTLITLSRRALNELHREAPSLFCILILNLARELARKLQFTDEFLLEHEPEFMLKLHDKRKQG